MLDYVKFKKTSHFVGCRFHQFKIKDKDEAVQSY